MRHRTIVHIFAALLALPLLASRASADTYQVLASFGSDPQGVVEPQAHPVLLNGNLLFTGVAAGPGDAGTLGSYNLASGQVSMLYGFTDGSFKYGGVTLGPDGFLYGVSYTSGIFYRIAADGTGYQPLYTYPGPSSFSTPLAVTNTALYGIAGFSASNNGQIFAMNLDGSNYHALYTFPSLDGASLWAGLTISGSTIYGSSLQDLFKLNIDDTGYTSLLANPGYVRGFRTTPILSGNTLYDMASGGGAYGGGAVVSVNTDGTGFQDLHDLDPSDMPGDSLYLVGNTLFGMTQKGGANNDGYIFSINTDGSNYQVVHTFSGAPTDGYWPRGSFTFDPSTNTLYGLTLRGGSNDSGTVFSITIPEPASLSLLTLAAPLLLRKRK